MRQKSVSLTKLHNAIFVGKGEKTRACGNCSMVEGASVFVYFIVFFKMYYFFVPGSILERQC